MGGGMTLTSQTMSGIDCYEGDPDCAAAYTWIQNCLRELCTKWLSSTAKLGDRRKGNLGEFIVFHVSESGGLNGDGYYCILGNAHKPLTSGLIGRCSCSVRTKSS